MIIVALEKSPYLKSNLAGETKIQSSQHLIGKHFFLPLLFSETFIVVEKYIIYLGKKHQAYNNGLFFLMVLLCMRIFLTLVQILCFRYT